MAVDEPEEQVPITTQVPKKKASGGLAPNDTLRPQTACTERKQNYSKGGHCRTSTVELASFDGGSSTRHTRTMNTREICSCRCLGASSYLAGIFLHCGASCRPGYVTMTIVQTTHLRTPENPVMPRMPCMSIEHLSRHRYTSASSVPIYPVIVFSP